MESVNENRNFLCVCEFLPNHLYFVTVQNINNGGSCDAVISHTDDLHFFTTDNELVYRNFYGDFGPLGIACLYKFCKKLTNKLAAYAGDFFYEKFINSRFGRREIAEKLRQKFVRKKIVVYYTSTNNEKRANAAYLISAFSLLYLGFSPREAYKTLQANKMRYRPFQDASIGLSPYKIDMKDCLNALHKKFVAFPSPVEEKDSYYHHPNFYIEYFLCNNVTDIIRLNQRTYDAKCFTIFKIRHHDLYMQDGTDPPESVLKSFMNIAETAGGAIAVHCKAGLGRTGTLIGAYLLKHYRMTPKEAIAWIRICRPGSVIGHQQAWLEDHKLTLWHHGNEWRLKKYGKTEIVPFLEHGIYSLKAPKKEFRGLREFLINLTKRSRYRFFAKNPSKKSKTKFQQTIRAILSSAKISKETEDEEIISEKGNSAASVVPQEDEPRQIIETCSSQLRAPYAKVESSNNIHYLKTPSPTYSLNEAPCGDNKLEYHPFYPPKQSPVFHGDAYTFEYPSQPQQTAEYNPNLYFHPATCETKYWAMQSNPNYSNGEFSNSTKMGYDMQKLYQERQYHQQKPEIAKIQPMPKCQSENLPPHYKKKELHADFTPNNTDWRKNSMNVLKYCNYSIERRRQREEKEMQKPKEDIVCAFDSRIPNVTQCSRVNGSHTVEQTGQEIGDFYWSKSPTSSHICSKSTDSSHGLLLSPEDLQSWIESFNQKGSGEIQKHKFEKGNVKMI